MRARSTPDRRRRRIAALRFDELRRRRRGAEVVALRSRHLPELFATRANARNLTFALSPRSPGPASLFLLRARGRAESRSEHVQNMFTRSHAFSDAAVRGTLTGSSSPE